MVMTRGKPMLDPSVHLKGATPETLAKALFRQTGPLPPRVRNPVRGHQVAPEKVPADEAGDGIPHLRKRV